MISVTGLESVTRSVNAALARQKGILNRYYRSFVVEVLTELVENTPQWSGDLAASWRVQVEGVTSRTGGSSTTGFKSTPRVRPAPHFRGDEPALVYALMVNSDVIESIRYNSRVTIFNDNPTADAINNPWSEELWLRPNNFIPGDVMAVAHAISKYGGGHIRMSGA